MKRLCFALLLALCATASPLSADTFDPEPVDPGFEGGQVSGDVSELFGDSAWFGRYRPHVGYRYQAGDTIGRIGGLSSFDAFFPVMEGYDSDWLMFIDARLLLGDDNHNLGSNVGLGARQYLPEYQRTIGGYIYHDTRDAGYANFDQISGGIETLGDIWDARLNWYVPTGTTRKQYATTHVNNGGSYQFIGHYLYGGTFTRYYQAAMKGLDMEAGAKFYTNDYMDLRAYAGWYHFQASGSPQAWGWKSRVESRISDMVALNLSVQNDRVFDTTVNFSVGIQWPSITGLRNGPRSDLKAWDRLGESPERLRAIVVDNQEVQDPNGGLIINPSTGNPYYFMHVATGGNSDGSYEDPYATLAAAFADPRTQAGDLIVYDHRNGSETGNFILADNTQVLSEGPAQFINSQFGSIQLPDSGTGINPDITGSFTMSNNSVLSGFDITTASGDSIIANGVGNIRIANSTITNTSTGAGINLNQVTGTITVENTPILKTNGRGLRILGGDADITLTNSTITTNNGSVSVDIQQNAGSVQLGQLNITDSNYDVFISSSSADVTIEELNSTNSVNGPLYIENHTGSVTLNGGTFNGSSTGVYVDDAQNVTVQNVTMNAPTNYGINANDVTNFDFSNNTINNAGQDAIEVTNASGTGTISNNKIHSIISAFDNAIEVTTNGDITLNIDDNTIDSLLTIGDNGIDVTTNAGNATVNIRNNQITSIANGFGDAISYTGNTTGVMNTTISNNKIFNTLGGFGDAIDVRINNGSATTTISQNTIDSDDLVNIFGSGVYLNLDTTGSTTSYITQNTISDDTNAALFNDGIALDIDRGTSHDVFINNNDIAQSGGIFDDGIEILMANGIGASANVQIHENTLNGSAGIGGRGLDVAVFSPDQIFLDVMDNTTDTALDFFAGVGGTINITDLPNLSANNNGAAVNLLGPGTIQNAP
ncbi:MAG: beta strand repeat-containing protein [Gimesia chilikensis]|uniref:beta strand repeat-containing protein n=1 Tax=Gimesia chilikensis TaxID=2605989 RepID=UPI0037A2B8FA